MFALQGAPDEVKEALKGLGPGFCKLDALPTKEGGLPLGSFSFVFVCLFYLFLFLLARLGA